MLVTTSTPSSPCARDSSADEFAASVTPPSSSKRGSMRPAAAPREGHAAVAANTGGYSSAASSLTTTTAWYNAGAYASSGAVGRTAGSAVGGGAPGTGRPRMSGLRIVLEGSDKEEDGNLAGSTLRSHSPSRDAARADGCGVDTPATALPTAATTTTTTVTLAAVSSAVAAVTITARESLVQWRRPQRPVVFREWYISRCCNEQQVRWMERVQQVCLPIQPLLVRYFQLWSLTGEAEFYTVFIPTVVWLGIPLDGVRVASLLCLGQYVTGTIKDAVCCPRPPCPPLQLYGKRETHDNEYGFPSTHSSHSGVFAYFLYGELLRLFPGHAVLCWLVAVFFFINVSFSRIYLGMHWIGDLIGGWVVAFLSILFHVAFLDRWEKDILTCASAPWWGYVLVYVVLHVLAMAHATPHDPCPCYVDSMRFTGVMMGSTVGFWAFHALYGSLAARPEPEHMFNVLFSISFLVQWVVCIVIVFVSKEVSSLAAGVALKVLFKFLSGAYAARLPKAVQRPYLAMATAVGMVTLGNERGPRRYVPFTANNSFSFMQNGSLANASLHDGTISSSRNTPNPRTETETVEEPDGYLNSYQVWSLRTHRHWWLWDVHKRTVSYAITGFVISFVCQVLLREAFGVGSGHGPQGHQGHISPPIPPLEG
ncbi:sphingosine-1-phosphate phosphatase [Novymonas esmeraldas]|uniref:Sphingosine-1-phosphate phosphatase n=1 Tax=Novymonas esmeraldas TaxID=1808958 RepID=A0AAW0EWG6_9TRYP